MEKVKCNVFIYALKHRETGMLSHIALSENDKTIINDYRKDLRGAIDNIPENIPQHVIVDYLNSCDIYCVISLDMVSGEVVPINSIVGPFNLLEESEVYE